MFLLKNPSRDTLISFPECPVVRQQALQERCTRTPALTFNQNLFQSPTLLCLSLFCGDVSYFTPQVQQDGHDNVRGQKQRVCLGEGLRCIVWRVTVIGRLKTLSHSDTGVEKALVVC